MCKANLPTPTRKVTIIHCWTAPRSRSTALAYSFDARSDCAVLDEPLSRRWLTECQEYIKRPYMKELINGTPHVDSTPEDSYKWKREQDDLGTRILFCLEDHLDQQAENGNDIDTSANTDIVLFAKHIAKHSPFFDFEKNCEKSVNGDASLAIFASTRNLAITHKHLLLIRDPVAVLSSWDAASAVHNSAISPNEVGMVHLLSIYSNVQSKSDQHGGKGVISVLDSDDLASNPKVALENICRDLDIPFTAQMLSWKKGPKKCDGPWAPWWYKGVHNSSGFDSHHARKYQTLDPNLLPAMRASLGVYNFLKQLTFSYHNRGPPPEEIYEDPRNENVLVFIGAPALGRLVPREFAGVSPFDSSVQGLDVISEGIRVYKGRILSLDKHLERLLNSAKAFCFKNIHSKEEIVEAIFRTLAVNGMRDGVHMRLTLTRGEKCTTSSMNPDFNVYGTTLVILAEWKPPELEETTTHDNAKLTSPIRGNSPSTVTAQIQEGFFKSPDQPDWSTAIPPFFG